MLNACPYQFIDIHYHANPDLFDRRYTALEAGKLYQQLDGAVYLKSHLGATSIQASLAQSLGLPVFPSVVLNKIAGGIDYRVIIKALAEYTGKMNLKMIVHFPTITGRKYISKLNRKVTHPQYEQTCHAPETLFDENKKLKPAVIEILKLAADYPIVLSSGHASKEEVFALIDNCQKYKVNALLLNQPANPLTGLSANELHAVAKNDFIWVEQTLLTLLLGHQIQEDFIEVITNIPRVIYSSDLGQTSQMTIAQWWNFTNQFFDEIKLTKARRKSICLDNPLKLLEI
ncbi:Uncharacterised protein (plasmid) [Legionella adelaidensis]|uniref:Amidohydrolase n=1 Tax=Legionella adelaidensis TaxID=45056 RepID=A0A0W0R0A5_9GAMM|nr:DUF6282 family protein [Legionella adelaidensis]KTC64488.1 hypothetical protein Lade_1782 [Legionella adelaidensis]VEH85856.1 Uncharacterised protein [Legionella adelaidensis]